MKRSGAGQNSIPYLVTHDGRTIRYPDPSIKVNDSVVIDIKTGKITDFIKFDTGNTVMVTAGRNTGRVGIITNRERHPSKILVLMLISFVCCSYVVKLGILHSCQLSCNY